MAKGGVEKAVQGARVGADAIQLAVMGKSEGKQKELEGIVNPAAQQVYQASGGGCLPVADGLAGPAGGLGRGATVAEGARGGGEGAESSGQEKASLFSAALEWPEIESYGQEVINLFDDSSSDWPR